MIRYFFRGFLTCVLLIQLVFISISAAQPDAGLLKTSVFTNARIILDKPGKAATEIYFLNNEDISSKDFFKVYFEAFNFSDDNKANSLSDISDKLGYRHYRFSQYYKGIELAEVQYLLHEKDGKVYLAHGNFVPGLNLDVTPVLTEEDALQCALKSIGATEYMWENLKSSASIRQQLGDSQVDFYPKGKIMLSTGRKELLAENFRLIYRFDIFAINPLSRNYVDIDATTGELVNKRSRLNTDNVEGQGVSLYNGNVSITVSDEDYPQWIDSASWHLDDWNAYGSTGESWWIADTLLSTYGGYDNNWYQVLETEPIILSGENPELSFYHRYSVESPEGYDLYDGWDGMNVRISTDHGQTWSILTNPVPAYTCSSLYSFGEIHGEGVGIPGWAGRLDQWTKVAFDLSSYFQDTIRLMFAFASDGAFSTADSPGLFGWQIDDINVNNATETFYSNAGSHSGIEVRNAFIEVNLIEGKYRLRETTRGIGIATYNAKRVGNLSVAEDFVEEDSFFSIPDNRPGASLHWAMEKTYDYYLERHGRQGIDETNNRLVAYANYLFDTDPNNAMWAGSYSLFGPGDGFSYGPFVSLDVVGHELAHGVTQFSANLIYENEPGGLNESFSDIFGASVEFFAEGIGNGDWIMGEDVALAGNPIRSMENPKSYSQPDTYKGTYWVSSVSYPDENNDNGGVHTNSGVQNYWFYLLAHGGNGTNDNRDEFSITGIGLADAEQIAYRNLTMYLQPASVYYDAARYSAQSAIDLFGQNSVQHQTVKEAWYAVGIYFDPRIVTPASVRIYARPDSPENTKILMNNIGMDTLQITDIQVTGTGFQIEDIDGGPLNFPVRIASDAQYSFRIEFTPETAGTTTGSLVISSNDPENPEKTIVLTGINTITGIEPSVTESSSATMYYPNPANDIIYFTNPERIEGVAIYSLAGTKLINVTDVSTGMDVSHLAPGLYLMKIDFTGKQTIKKFVIE